MVLYSYQSQFIDSNTADNYFQLLANNISWKKFQPSPNSRLVYSWDPEAESGLINDIIFQLVQLLQNKKSVQVCGVFINYYKNGNDYCPYHKDSYGTDVYTISLGETRDLLIKPDGMCKR